MLRLRFSEMELFLFLAGESFSDLLRFRIDLSGVTLQKHGLLDSSMTPSVAETMQSRQVAIASDSGDVKLFF